MNKIKINNMNKRGTTDLWKKALGFILLIFVVALIIVIAKDGLGSIRGIWDNFFPDSIGGKSNGASSTVVNVDNGVPAIMYNIQEDLLYYRINGAWEHYQFNQPNKVGGQITEGANLANNGWRASFQNYWHIQKQAELPEIIKLPSGKEIQDPIFPAEPLSSLNEKNVLRNYVIVNFPDAKEEGYGWWKIEKSNFGWGIDRTKHYANNYLISYDNKLYRQKDADKPKVFDSYELIGSPKGDEREILRKIIELRDSPIKKPIQLSLIRSGIPETKYFCTIKSGNSLAVDLSIGKIVDSEKECE